MNTEIERRLWSVDEYRRMAEAGILTDLDRVELVHGEIVQMTPIDHHHSAAVAALVALFNRRLGDRVVVWSQGSMPLPPRSMPEPDVLVLEPRADFYRHAYPRPEDVVLLVEVAGSSLRYDRLVKMILYAAAGIRESWVVDLDGGQVDVFRRPTNAGYAQVERFGRGAPFAPSAFPDLLLSVGDILG